MNQDRLQGICKQAGGWLRELHGRLMRDPVAAAEGKRARLAGAVQEQRGMSKQAADREMAEFRNRNRNWLNLKR